MRIIIILFVTASVISVLIAYACCVAAGMADAADERLKILTTAELTAKKEEKPG